MTNNENDQGSGYGQFHRRVFEAKGGIFAVATTIAILIGGIVEIVPMYTAGAGPETGDWVTPYTPLEVAGRDIYIREGCYLCHSQWSGPCGPRFFGTGSGAEPLNTSLIGPSSWGRGAWAPTCTGSVRSTRMLGISSICGIPEAPHRGASCPHTHGSLVRP